MKDILLIARFLFIVSILIILVFTFISLIFKESRSALIELFKEAKIFLVIAFSVLLIIFLFVGFIITSFFTYSIKYEKREVIEETAKEIVSLNYNKEINGGFTLGFSGIGNGNLNTDNYYYFYSKDNNRYKLEKINVEDVFIEETDEAPKIVYRKLKEVADKIKTPTKFGDFLGLTYKKDEAKWIIFSEKEIILYIPTGSIIENFNPNVE